MTHLPSYNIFFLLLCFLHSVVIFATITMFLMFTTHNNLLIRYNHHLSTSLLQSSSHDSFNRRHPLVMLTTGMKHKYYRFSPQKLNGNHLFVDSSNSSILIFDFTQLMLIDEVRHLFSLIDDDVHLFCFKQFLHQMNYFIL